MSSKIDNNVRYIGQNDAGAEAERTEMMAVRPEDSR